LGPEQFPRKPDKGERPQRRGAVFYVRRADDTVLVRTRPPRGLLGGMTEFPGTDWGDAFDPAAALAMAPVRAAYQHLPTQVRHVFTHFALSLDVFVGNVGADTKMPADCRFVATADLATEALPSLMRKVIKVVRDSGIERIAPRKATAR
jgi:A/G-specific adenine glycosylase